MILGPHKVEIFKAKDDKWRWSQVPGMGASSSLAKATSGKTERSAGP
jgi:hypothetical protein